MKACFICGGQASHYCNWEKYEYVQCNTCQLVYLNEMPTEQEIYTAYEGSKLKSIRRKITGPFRSLEHLKGYKERVADFDMKLKKAIPFMNPGLDMRIMDIGCNKCFLLEAAVHNGFEPWGVELIPEMTMQFKRKYKEHADKIFTEDFQNVSAKLYDNMFSMITAFDLVEHLREPEHEFKDIYRMLMPGGVFFLQTPNTGSPEAKALKEKWGSIKAYEHYQLWNEENLTRFAKQLGYTKVDFLDPALSHHGDMLAILTK